MPPVVQAVFRPDFLAHQAERAQGQRVQIKRARQTRVEHCCDGPVLRRRPAQAMTQSQSRVERTHAGDAGQRLSAFEAHGNEAHFLQSARFGKERRGQGGQLPARGRADQQAHRLYSLQ